MPKRLLLADDSITIQKVVTLAFANEDVAIESAPDGSVALDMARKAPPDIVLADVSMPGLDGYELCGYIKTDPALCEIPVVLLVGTFETFDEDRATRACCDGHLTKPFETAELIKTVHSLAKPAGSKRRVAKPASQEKDRRAAGSLVSQRTKESFLGTSRILDLFQAAPEPAETVAAPAPSAPAPPPQAAPPTEPAPVPEAAPMLKAVPVQGTPSMHVIPFPGARAGTADLGPAWLSEDLVNLIIERVVERMSQEVVREVAWEVVPEMAEMVIREVLREHTKPPSS